MDSSKIKLILIVVFAMFFAIYLGVAAAMAQTEAIAWVVGIGALIFVLALAEKVWILIPFGLILQGTVNALPGSPPVWALGTFVTITIFTLRFAMHKRDFAFKPDMLDFAILLQIIAVGQAYVRNPSGLLIFGGDTAGGKPYLTFAVAFLAFFCLSVVRTDMRMFRIAVIMMVVATIADGMIAVLSDYIPLLAMAVLPIYSNTNVGVAISGDAANTDTGIARAGGAFGEFGRALGVICFTMARPLHCLLPTHPLLFTATGVGFVMVMLSGFRSMLIYLFVVFVVSAYIKKKHFDIIAISVGGILALCLLIGSGQVRNLPFGAQRALSFLPIEIDGRAREDADKSSDWRFEMWKLALTTDRYIQNKWFGDGFAVSAREMRAQLDAAQGFGNGVVIDNKEAFLLRGSYHGFHVECIRFTGAFGLACAIFAMIVFFNKARSLIGYYRHHPMFPYVAFICIPFLIYPFWALLVFGAYRAAFPQFLATAGLLKMLDALRIQEITAKAAAEAEPEKTPSAARLMPQRTRLAAKAR
jgi:hypothetical protein